MNHRRLFIVVALAALLVGLAALPAIAGAVRKADKVFYGGVVYTANAKHPMARAVAVRGSRIQYVGSNWGAARYVGRHTRLVNLHGKLMLPGFIDAHAHASMSVSLVYAVDLYGLGSLEAYLDAVSAFAAANPALPAVQGTGWSNTVAPDIGPLAADLDAVVSDRPVALQSEDYHSLWVNTKALELAGVSGATPDPEGGKIERVPGTAGTPGNPYGTPSGTLRESAAALVSDVLPDYTVAQYKQGILYFQKEVAGPFGITSVYDPWLGIGSNGVKAYEQLARAGKLTMRVRGALGIDPGDDLSAWVKAARAERAKHKRALFRTTAVKFFADGVIEGHTGYLKEPYADALEYAGDADYRGMPLWEPDALAQAFTAVDAARLQIHVHSIGDAATTEVLDALAAARAANGKRDWRPGITHLQLVDPADYARFRQLGVTAVPQPYWFLMDDYYWYLQLPYLGQQRADDEYPMKSLFSAGARVASASDFPVTIPPDPIDGIQTGVMRWAPGWDIPESDVLWPEERVSVKRMIDSFTINGAKAAFTERVTGSIARGKSADLIVLSRNILKTPPKDIGDAEVTLTMFRGRIIHRAK